MGTGKICLKERKWCYISREVGHLGSVAMCCVMHSYRDTLRSYNFHILPLKMIFVTREKVQKKWSIILCHYRLGMEPQTRNHGARQGHDSPAVPLSAILTKSTFSCLPLKTLLKRSLSGKIMHHTELDFPLFFPHGVSLLHRYICW